jgi:hypothetical protein
MRESELSQPDKRPNVDQQQSALEQPKRQDDVEVLAALVALVVVVTLYYNIVGF